MQLRVSKMKLFILFAATIATSISLQAADEWVPYTAHFTETTTVRDAHGSLNKTVKAYTEYRTADGSIARYQAVGNSVVSGTLWLACGDMIHLDFGHKTATKSNSLHAARQHFVLHKNWPTLGTSTIAGLPVTGWPAHIANGTGSMWVDVADDVIAKIETHVQNPSGVSVDTLKVLDSIEIPSTVDDSKVQIPPGFQLDSSAQYSCANSPTR